MTESTGGQLNFDVNQNSESLHISPEIYMKIVEKAVEQTTKDIDDLKAALSGDDNETIKAISHRLKGDFDNLRITDIAAIAHEMNDIAKVEFKKDKISSLLNNFIVYFVQLKEIVDNLENKE